MVKHKLPEFLFSNSHVGLPLYTQIDEEQFQLLHTAAMEICDMNVLAPNLHVMPAQFRTEQLDDDQETLLLLMCKDEYTKANQQLIYYHFKCDKFV